MATAITIFLGRLGSLFGNMLFGYLIDEYCSILIIVMAAQLFQMYVDEDTVQTALNRTDLFAEEKISKICNPKEERKMKQQARKEKMKNLLHTSKKQMHTLVKTPYAKRLFSVSCIMFCITSTYYALMTWFPELFQRSADYTNFHNGQTESFCQVSSWFSQMAGNTTIVSNSHRNHSVYRPRLVRSSLTLSKIFVHELLCILNTFANNKQLNSIGLLLNVLSSGDEEKSYTRLGTKVKRPSLRGYAPEAKPRESSTFVPCHKPDKAEKRFRFALQIAADYFKFSNACDVTRLIHYSRHKWYYGFSMLLLKAILIAMIATTTTTTTTTTENSCYTTYRHASSITTTADALAAQSSRHTKHTHAHRAASRRGIDLIFRVCTLLMYSRRTRTFRTRVDNYHSRVSQTFVVTNDLKISVLRLKKKNQQAFKLLPLDGNDMLCITCSAPRVGYEKIKACLDNPCAARSMMNFVNDHHEFICVRSLEPARVFHTPRCIKGNNKLIPQLFLSRALCNKSCCRASDDFPLSFWPQVCQSHQMTSERKQRPAAKGLTTQQQNSTRSVPSDRQPKTWTARGNYPQNSALTNFSLAVTSTNRLSRGRRCRLRACNLRHSVTGAMGIVFPYLGEFQPTKHREKILCWMEMFWTIGVIALPRKYTLSIMKFIVNLSGQSKLNLAIFSLCSDRLVNHVPGNRVHSRRVRLQILESLCRLVRPPVPLTGLLAVRFPREPEIPARVRRDRRRPCRLPVHLRAEHGRGARSLPGQIPPGETQLQGQEHSCPEIAQAQGSEGPCGRGLGPDQSPLQAALSQEHSAGLRHTVWPDFQLLHPHDLVPRAVQSFRRVQAHQSQRHRVSVHRVQSARESDHPGDRRVPGRDRHVVDDLGSCDSRLLLCDERQSKSRALLRLRGSHVPRYFSRLLRHCRHVPD
ncbi:unnamed protein product [Trichogramma brassicae]|uniref:Uncharacterized protein n=1 Tax=Trichogramma brassicae TaxID=86971 RepID=A0A6H5IDD8_9HYME|nr:unnamed protein product [Trichogramma brassicae]